MKPFKYTPEWYADEYHAGLKDPKYVIDPRTSHPERDAACLRDLDVSAGQNMLVAGCGGGDNFWLLDKEFGCRQQMWGIDFSGTAVDFCNRYFPWVAATVGDVSEMPYDNNAFDIVLAMDITEHLPFDIYLFFLFEMRRVLRPGGRAAVLPGMTRRPEHINLLPLDLVERHLRKARFEVVTRKPEWVIVRKP